MSTIDTDLPMPPEEPDDEVELELEALAIRRRRKLPRVTLTLAVALVGAGMFIGGAEAQRHFGSSPSATSSNSAASLASRFRRAGAGKAQTVFGGGDATVGTVTAIKGSTLYVTDASGNTVKIATSAGSQVTKTVTGSVDDVHPGDTVVVTGTKRSNGTIDARSISLGGGGLGSATAGGPGGNGGATGFNGSSSKGGG
jgi:hypothetical protein